MVGGADSKRKRKTPQIASAQPRRFHAQRTSQAFEHFQPEGEDELWLKVQSLMK
jgi:hypothetical protein